MELDQEQNRRPLITDETDVRFSCTPLDLRSAIDPTLEILEDLIFSKSISSNSEKEDSDVPSWSIFFSIFASVLKAVERGRN